MRRSPPQADITSTATPRPAQLPSWLRWPPNCCETCVGWQREAGGQFLGLCVKADSLELGTHTDTRFRCPAFVRRDGV